VIALLRSSSAAAGIASGASAASLTCPAPSGNKRIGTTIGSLAPRGDPAGAILAGALVQLSRHASTEMFIALDILFLLGLLAVTLIRDPVSRRPGALRSLAPGRQSPRQPGAGSPPRRPC
jgi:hypothetical protein